MEVFVCWCYLDCGVFLFVVFLFVVEMFKLIVDIDLVMLCKVVILIFNVFIGLLFKILCVLVNIEVYSFLLDWFLVEVEVLLVM